MKEALEVWDAQPPTIKRLSIILQHDLWKERPLCGKVAQVVVLALVGEALRVKRRRM